MPPSHSIQPCTFAVGVRRTGAKNISAKNKSAKNRSALRPNYGYHATDHHWLIAHEPAITPRAAEQTDTT